MQLPDIGSLTTLFAASAGIATLAAAHWLGGPRQLKPTNTAAKVITARKFPNFWEVQKFAVKDGSALYLKFGASKPTEVPLKVYSVTVDKTNDHALVLNDKMKIDVSVMFQVSLEDPTEAILKAVGALNGDFTDNNVQNVLEARFDSALRLAAANMGIEEINSHREKFIQQVKEGLKLDDVGFKLNEVSLRTLTPALLSAYNPSNSYDAEGMKKVVEIVQASERDRNATEQEALTRIAQTNQEQELKRYDIKRTQETARLAQEEAIANASSEQSRRIAEVTALNGKQARMAQISADEETGARDIAKDQQLQLSAVERDKAVALAAQSQKRLTREAEIATETAVETADREKEIALALKNAAASDAQATANKARAAAVVAEQEVITARSIAEADRTRQVEIIVAETEAGKVAAGQKIDADAKVYVAEQGAKAIQTEAEGIARAAVIDANADAESTRVRAVANYDAVLQPLKAAAEGKALEADALRKLNEAINILSAEARAQQVDLERVKITPEVVGKLTAALGSVDKFTVLSGMPGMGSGGPGTPDGGGGGSSNIFNDVVKAVNSVTLSKPLLAQVLKHFGGDAGIANFVPDVTGTNDNSTGGPAPTAMPA